MLTISGRNDFFCSYFVTQRDEVDWTPLHRVLFLCVEAGEFNQSFMGALYAYGERRCLTAKPVTTTSMFFPDDAVYRPTPTLMATSST